MIIDRKTSTDVLNVSRRAVSLGFGAGALVLATGLPVFAEEAKPEEPKWGGDGMPHGLRDDPTLFVSIGISIAVCTKILGALPVFAFSVLPAVAALALSRSTLGVLTLALIFGGMSGGLGYVAATIFNYPVGPSQTLVGCGIVGIAAIVYAVRRGYERLRGRGGIPSGA